MKNIEYNCKGTCSQVITFDLDDDNKIHNIAFYGGCNGNQKGIAALCEGMDAAEVAKRVRGIRCGFKPTSCPDQLGRAIEKALSEN